VSPAGPSRGRALQAPANKTGDQEMLETRSSGGSPSPRRKAREGPSTRSSRPVPATEAIRKDGESRQPHGSLSRPPVAIRSSGTGATANMPVVLPGGENHSGPAATRRRGSGPCACTACRSQRGTVLSQGVVLTIVSSWQKSEERRRPRGRTQQRETGAACRSETRRGATFDAGMTTLPMEGALDHQYLRRPSRVDVGGWSWPCSRRRFLTSVSGGLLLQAKASRGNARMQEGRRSAVTGASEDVSSVDVSGRERPDEKWKPTHPKCVGRRETRHASAGPRKGTAPVDRRTRRGCP